LRPGVLARSSSSFCLVNLAGRAGLDAASFIHLGSGTGKSGIDVT